jgi:long-chain acyl-CoA synthetase
VPDGDLDQLVERLGAATIPDLAAESARRFPDRVAVTVDGEPVTHAGLAAGASQVAAWLAARTEPGDRVLLAAGSSLDFLRCYLGARADPAGRLQVPEAGVPGDRAAT